LRETRALLDRARDALHQGGRPEGFATARRLLERELDASVRARDEPHVGHAPAAVCELPHVPGAILRDEEFREPLAPPPERRHDLNRVAHVDAGELVLRTDGEAPARLL